MEMLCEKCTHGEFNNGYFICNINDSIRNEYFKIEECVCYESMWDDEDIITSNNLLNEYKNKGVISLTDFVEKLKCNLNKLDKNISRYPKKFNVNVEYDDINKFILDTTNYDIGVLNGISVDIKECEYCSGNTIESLRGDDGILKDKNDKYCIYINHFNDSGDIISDINYCPFCGRKL